MQVNFSKIIRKVKPIGYVIARTALKSKNRLNNVFKQRGYNITVDHLDLLFILWEKEGLSQSELANLVTKDKTNITRMLDVMEKNNIIQRKNDAHDRRAYNIFLTDVSRGLKDELQNLLIKENERIIKGLSKKEIREFLTILDIINKNLDD